MRPGPAVEMLAGDGELSLSVPGPELLGRVVEERYVVNLPAAVIHDQGLPPTSSWGRPLDELNWTLEGQEAFDVAHTD